VGQNGILWERGGEKKDIGGRKNRNRLVGEERRMLTFGERRVNSRGKYGEWAEATRGREGASCNGPLQVASKKEKLWKTGR